MEFITIGKITVYVLAGIVSFGIYQVCFRKAVEREGGSFLKTIGNIYIYADMIFFFPVWIVFLMILALFNFGGHYTKEEE